MSEDKPLPEPLVITKPMCHSIVDLLVDFVGGHQDLMRSGLLSRDPAKVEQAHLLLQEFAGAMAWPGLAMVPNRLKTSGLEMRLNRLLASAHERLGSGQIQASEPLPALASMVERQCQASLAAIKAKRWPDTAYIHALNVTKIVTRLGGATPEMLAAHKELETAYSKTAPSLTLGGSQRPATP